MESPRFINRVAKEGSFEIIAGEKNILQNRFQNISKCNILSCPVWEAPSLKEGTGDGDYNLKYPLQVVAVARSAISSLGL